MLLLIGNFNLEFNNVLSYETMSDEIMIFPKKTLIWLNFCLARNHFKIIINNWNNLIKGFLYDESMGKLQNCNTSEDFEVSDLSLFKDQARINFISFFGYRDFIFLNQIYHFNCQIIPSFWLNSIRLMSLFVNAWLSLKSNVKLRKNMNFKCWMLLHL